ncbi:hypothetical protein Y1Q_0017217 [Alligator mississippiensis]|uniref:Reverse transcriptase domain-containing protein n=1 Tax=Alligator mississippiensis TaxID=8496 RepID=A0A151NKS6_ALLMI|nr:hypothetical protein Y1Q_0017217 [Alligator mississippiensis]
MGVPSTFIRWIRTLYTEVSSEVQIHGFLSTRIAVESGVQQGCPLSLILFICTIEPLAQHLRQDPRINGVHIPGSSNREAKVLAYMDDLNILCWNRGPWVMELLWFYETLNQCRDVYDLQNAGPVTMKSHKKIQEMVKKRDTMSPVDLLLGGACQDNLILD